MTIVTGPSDRGDAESVEEAPRVRIASGSPTPVEVAAVTAVVAAALDALAAESRVRGVPLPSGWERSRRDLRRSLSHGDWRGSGR